MVKGRKLIGIVLLLIILAITVFLNLLAQKLDMTVDLTGNEMYSVSDAAREITGKSGREINVYCFADNENKTNVITEFTRNFCKTSDKLHFSVVNPVKHPEITKRYTVSGDMITDKTVVFDNGENYKIIPYEEMFSYNCFVLFVVF